MIHIEFISYAQNFEDVFLNRVFKNKNNGFYVDVGAGYPMLDSVTKSFYDRGWNGINIEPQKKIFQILKNFRARDININSAISNKKVLQTFTTFENAWGWATLSKEFPNPLGFKTKKKLVKTDTLNNILKKYNIREIDFLKIDVEGEEFNVLRTINLKKWEPRIILLEVVTQTSDISDWKDIQRYLKEYEYIFATFDGINIYFVKKNDKAALEQLSKPISCLDNFIQAKLLLYIDEDYVITNGEYKKFLHDREEYKREIENQNN